MSDTLRLADVRGHQRALGILRRSVLADRLHHAYLFAGPEGVGKRRAADALTALVLCTDRRGDAETLDSCGHCIACRKLEAGSHPDRVVVEPDGRFIKIAQIRDVHSQTRFRPFEGERRVVVIDRAETIREEAANALLKTLEEPRGDTMFILVTANPQRLLTTIRSRCQTVRFGGLDPTDVAAILVDSGETAEASAVAGRLSGGSVGGASHVLASSVYAERSALVAKLCGLSSFSSSEILGLAEELGRSDVARDALAIARTLYRDVALLAAGASDDRLIHVDLADVLRTLRERHSLADLAGSVDRLNEAEAMLDGNVNPRMAMETLLLTLADCPTRPLAPRLPQ